MLRVGIEQHPLMVTAALVWSEELPRPLQQILFDAAESIPAPGPAGRAALRAMHLSVTQTGQALIDRRELST
jgi:hypothetical protein